MRKHYLDNIRWATVVLVVIYHVIYMYNANGIVGVVGKITNLDVQYYDVFQYMVYPWFMMILFIVSGISARCYLERHTAKEFAKSRTAKLLVPSTIGLFAFQFIQGLLNVQLSQAFEKSPGIPLVGKIAIVLASGIGVLWYIQLLWLLSMILLLIRAIEKDRLWKLCSKAGIIGLIVMYALIFGAAQILNTPMICVYRFGYYGASFLFGYYVFSHDEMIDILKRLFYPLLVAALALGTAFCINYFDTNYADAPTNRTLLFVFFAFTTSLAILGGAARYADFETPFTKWMSSHSFGLYVFHYLGISAVGVYMGMSRSYPPALVYVLSLIAGFATGFGMYEIISRIPGYRWAVLGIKKK